MPIGLTDVGDQGSTATDPGHLGPLFVSGNADRDDVSGIRRLDLLGRLRAAAGQRHEGRATERERDAEHDEQRRVDTRLGQ